MSGLVLIDSLNAPSGGAFTFSPLTLTGYPIVQVVISGVSVTTDSTIPLVTYYVGGVEITANYQWALQSASAVPGTLSDSDSSDPSISLVSNDAPAGVNQAVGNAATETFSAILHLDEPTSTTLYKKMTYKAVYRLPSGDVNAIIGQGFLANTGAINGLKITGNSSLTAGKVRILGLA